MEHFANRAHTKGFLKCSGKGQRLTLAASALHLPFVRHHLSLNLEVTISS